MPDIQKFYPTATPIAENSLQDLVVVTVISNPIRYWTRYELYERFERAMREAGATLVTVEQAFGERPFVVTKPDNPLHVQLRGEDELWLKENMLNIGINYASQLFPDWRYVAWIDADVLPMSGSARHWLEETVQQLQHYHVVQMFETAYDLDPKGKVLGDAQESFMSKYVKSGYALPKKGGFWSGHYYMEHGHPGFAWAMTRFAADNMSSALGGPLVDFAILGAGDRHMALGWVGCMDQSFEHLNKEYRHALMQWQIRCERWLKRDVGFVPGSIYHFWHGKKRDRGYADRWKILRDHTFDPMLDLTRDAQGLYRLETWEPRQIRLRDQIRSYFRSRNEDSIDVE
jgi:hypothetical protein